MRSKYGHDRGVEAAIRIILALVIVCVTGSVCPSTQTAPGGGWRPTVARRRAAERILTYTGTIGGEGREISAWFMKATGWTEW